MSGGQIMFVLGIVLVSTANNGGRGTEGTRLTILLLLLLAVALIIAGAVIALLTMMRKRRASDRYADHT